MTTYGGGQVFVDDGAEDDWAEEHQFGPAHRVAKRLIGRCANGAERDGGAVLHAVFIRDDWGRALCGAKPGRLSNGWSTVCAVNGVTCKRCIRKMVLRWCCLRLRARRRKGRTMASELDELIAMSDEDLDAEVRRLGGDPAQMIAETTRLVERLGKVRDAGIVDERERVRAVLIDMRDHESDRGCGVFISDLAARLGIDLRQPAGKGEG